MNEEKFYFKASYYINYNGVESSNEIETSDEQEAIEFLDNMDFEIEDWIDNYYLGYDEDPLEFIEGIGEPEE